MASAVETPTDAGRAAAPVSLSRRRAIAAWSLVGSATILLVLSSLTIWAKRRLLDSDAYAELSVEMLQDDEIRSALSLYLVDTLYDNADVAGALRSELPPSTRAFAPLAEAGLRQLSLRTANQLLASAPFQSLWERANRMAHVGALIALGVNVLRRQTLAESAALT
jgi:hypothetical protein